MSIVGCINDISECKSTSESSSFVQKPRVEGFSNPVISEFSGKVFQSQLHLVMALYSGLDNRSEVHSI